MFLELIPPHCIGARRNFKGRSSGVAGVAEWAPVPNSSLRSTGKLMVRSDTTHFWSEQCSWELALWIF
jgi:hypothetical protein